MKNKLLIVLASCLLALAACNPIQPPASATPDVAAIVAATLQALTATAPTAAPPTAPVNGLPVSYNNISFTIPLELNASASSSVSTNAEFPFVNPSNGPMAAHVVFQLTNYPLEGDANTMVFKASDYAAYDAYSQDVVTSLLAGQDTAQPLPDALTYGEFYAQAKAVEFKNGHGVRYITEPLTGFAAINNRDVFYYYQGITNDGAYFVSAVLHIQASFLAADGDEFAHSARRRPVPVGRRTGSFDLFAIPERCHPKVERRRPKRVFAVAFPARRVDPIHRDRVGGH